jgi:hypothetical protein
LGGKSAASWYSFEELGDERDASDADERPALYEEGGEGGIEDSEAARALLVVAAAHCATR